MRHTQSSLVIVLCTKLDAECDRQATVVGRLLTTLGDERRAVAKLFSVQRLEKSSRGNYAYGWRHSNFVFVWQTFSSFRGLCPLDQKLWNVDPVEAWPRTLCIGSKSRKHLSRVVHRAEVCHIGPWMPCLKILFYIIGL